MNITKEKIKKFKPCAEGYQWYLDHGSPDLLETLLDVNKVKPSWASWLYTRLMSEKQRKQFAIYAAEEVLHIFEEKYPNDNRPRLAIVAAKIALESNTKANREAARRAAWGASDAAHGARDAAHGARDAADANAAAAAAYGARGAGVYGAAYAAANAVANASAGAAGYAVADAYDAVVAVTARAGAGSPARVDAAVAAMREKLIGKVVKLLEKK